MSNYTKKQIYNILMMQLKELGESIWEEFEWAVDNEELGFLIDKNIQSEEGKSALKEFLSTHLIQFDLHIESIVLFDEQEYYDLSEFLHNKNIEPSTVFPYTVQKDLDVYSDSTENINDKYDKVIVPVIADYIFQLQEKFGGAVSVTLDELVYRGNHYLGESNPNWLDNYFAPKNF